MYKLSQRILQGSKARLFTSLFSLISIMSWAATISGPTTVGVGTVQNYTYSNGNILQSPKWICTKGTISTSVSGTTYTASITFTTTGTGTLTFQDVNGTLATLSITVSTCGTITAPVTVNGSHCGPGSVLLSCDITPGSGYLPRWYAASNPSKLIMTGDDEFYTTPSLTTTTDYLVSKYSFSTGCESSKTKVTATILSTTANAGQDQTGTSTCGLTTTSLTGSGIGSWSVVSGTGSSFGNTSSATSTFTGTAGAAYVLRWAQTDGTCPGTDDVNITFNIKPTASATALPSLCSNTAGSITITNPNNVAGTTFSWTSTFNNAEITPSTASPGNVITGTYYNTDKITTGSITHTITPYTASCNGAPITTTVTVNNTPASPSPGFQMVYASDLAFFQIQVPTGLEARWFLSQTAPTPFLTGSSFQNQTVSDPDSYYISFRDPALLCESPRVLMSVTRIAKSSPASVKKEAVRVTGQTTTTMVSQLDNNFQKAVTTSYMDGLSRVVQQIAQKATANATTSLQYDVIQPVEYDAFGRTTKTYLPYTKNNTAGYQDTYVTDQASFYTAINDKIANDNKPFAGTAYELSPLGRPLEQGLAGQDWQPGTGHTTRIGYSYNAITNASDEVWIMKADPLRVVTINSVQKTYADNTLTRLEQTRADGQKEIVFVDGIGRTVASKELLNGTISGTAVDYLSTYYIYDDMNNLRFIIPPAGFAAWKANGWVMTTTIQDQHLHQFIYDARGRLTQKKTPGQAWLYYGYDNLNRLVLMQDGNLRPLNKWAFVKYDQLGRTAMTGLYTNTSQTDLTSIQTLFNGLYASTTAPWYEVQGTTLYGYTNLSFPTINSNNTALEVLSVNYYDDYDFDNDTSPNFAYDYADLTGLPTITNPYMRGRITGNRKLILGTANWITSGVFYDNYGRAIQTQTNNHLNLTGIDKSSVVYDFEGKTVQTKKYHNGGGTNVVTTVQTPVYHNTGRIIGLNHSINGAAAQLVSQYQYNDLGQVVTKQLHNIGGTNFLQNVDYRYTINGWLESINNAQLASDGGLTNNDTNDYFGMELLYNKTETSGLGNTALFNGNVSAVKWKAMDNTTAAAGQRSYAFMYDKTDKLLSAVFKKYGTTAWDQEQNTLNETLSYDHNGNILSLKRNQNLRGLNGVTVTSTAQLIDDLTYIYGSGNQLTKVTDATANVAGFKDGANAATEYVYDAQGNATSDQNKGISSMNYNVLGKVQAITFSDGRTISYLYDAGGNKLKMTTVISGVTKVTDYANGYVYDNGALSFFGLSEGRVVKNGSTYEYQYNIVDNQGNTRIVFTSAIPVIDQPKANFETSTNSAFKNYTNLSSLPLYDHTDAGTVYNGSQLLNGGYNSQIGVAKSYKVYPGDKIKIEAYAKYSNPTSNSGNLFAFASALLNAFGAPAPGPTETGTISSALNSWGSIVAAGGDGESAGAPHGSVNIIVFDKNYKLLDYPFDQIDPAAQQIGLTPVVSHDYMSLEYVVKEEGYVFAYVANENATQVDVYFDDVAVTYTPTNVIQSNEYYPFGLQTANSWTRAGSTNNFLYNEGSELNATSGFYDLPYRNYDAALGRFFQVDPLAHMDYSSSPFVYAHNNPIMFNDPSGLQPPTGYSQTQLNSLYHKVATLYSSYDDWAMDTGYGGVSGGAYKPDGPYAVTAMQVLGGAYADAEAVNTGKMSMSDYMAKYARAATAQDFADLGLIWEQIDPHKPRYEGDRYDLVGLIHDMLTDLSLTRRLNVLAAMIDRSNNRSSGIAKINSSVRGSQPSSDFIYDNNNQIGLGLEIAEPGLTDALEAIISSKPGLYSSGAKIAVGGTAVAGVALNLGVTVYTLTKEHQNGGLKPHSYVNMAVTGVTTVLTVTGIVIASGAVVISSPVWGTGLAIGGAVLGVGYAIAQVAGIDDWIDGK